MSLAALLISFRSMHPIRVSARLVLVLLFAAAAYSQEAPSDSAEDDATGWVAVAEWSGGDGQLVTEDFEVSADVWRISYSSTAGERFGIIDVLVNDSNGEFVTAGYGLQANDLGIMSGSFMVESGGSFRLEINSQRLDWQVVVEQPE